MGVVLKISNVDRSNYVDRTSLRIDNILTKQVDRCSFTIQNFGDKTFHPAIGREVIIEDDGTRVFGGVIVRVERTLTDYPMVEYRIECSDFTRILDQHLVAETYEDVTIDQIIADIVANWAPAGFTTTEVAAPVLIKFMQFKYEPVSDCLRQLAEIGGYDWYVDYNKDIYFKEPTATPAPVDIEDTTGVYAAGSLVIRQDSSQLRNSIIVRGGEYLGTQFSFAERADGKKLAFELPYKFKDFSTRVNGVAQDLGIDNINDPADFDALYNFQEKIVKFRDDNKPGEDAILSFGGKPYLPVIVKYKDQLKIDAIFSAEQEGDGIYEYLVVDKSIGSKEGARQRAIAEIVSFGETLSEGSFITETVGFLAGQEVLVNSAALGINETFVVNKVTSTMKDTGDMIYSVSLITTKTMNFISVMKKLLLAETKKIEINPDEVLDLVEGAFETISISEVIASSLIHNPQTETITLTEDFDNNGLDFGTTFHLGSPFTPTGVQRIFVLDGSRLA